MATRMNPSFWDERYRAEDFIYGNEPNTFFKEELLKIPPGKIYLPGEGEGRNAVYAASLGWEVTAMDWSSEARKKALDFAKTAGCVLDYQIADLLSFTPHPSCFDAVASIFIHFSLDDREVFHRNLLHALKPGGVFIFLAYSKEQKGKESGGPQDTDLLYSLEEVCESFIELDFSFLAREVTTLSEGKYHQGDASVIKFVGRKVQ